MYNKLLRYILVFILFSLRTAPDVKKNISYSYDLISKPKSLKEKPNAALNSQGAMMEDIEDKINYDSYHFISEQHASQPKLKLFNSDNVKKEKSKNVFKIFKNRISKIFDKLAPNDNLMPIIKSVEEEDPKEINISNFDQENQLLATKRCHCVDTANCAHCNALFNQYNKVDRIRSIVGDCYALKLDKIDESKIAPNNSEHKNIEVISFEPKKSAISITEYIKNPMEQAKTLFYSDRFSAYGLHFNKYGVPLSIKEDKSYRINSNVLRISLEEKGHGVLVPPKKRASEDLIKENAVLTNAKKRKSGNVIKNHVTTASFSDKVSSSRDCNLTNSSNSGSSRRRVKSKKTSSKKNIDDDIKIVFFDNKEDVKSIKHNDSKVEEVDCAPKKDDLLLKKTAMPSKEVIDKTSLRKFNIGYLIISIIMIMMLLLLIYLVWPYINELIQGSND